MGGVQVDIQRLWIAGRESKNLKAGTRGGTYGPIFFFRKGIDMAQGDILRAEFCINVARQPAAFTMGYKIANSGVGNTDNSCVALSQLLQNTDIANLHMFLGNDATWEGWRVSFVRGQDPMPPVWRQIVDSTGQRSSHCIPLVSAMVVRLIQFTLPSKNNGRLYIPGIAEGDTTLSRVTAQNVIDGIRDAINDILVVSGNVGGVDWAFDAQILGGSLQTGFTESTVERISVQPQLGSQRRRRTREHGTFA